MPWKSDAQRRWGHSAAGREALGSKVEEFDAATKGKSLPERKTMAAKKDPIGQAGGYAAPVDTTLMDQEMKETLGLGQKPPVENPVRAFARRIGGILQGTKPKANKPNTINPRVGGVKK